jgi:hypothetical protein
MTHPFPRGLHHALILLGVLLPLGLAGAKTKAPSPPKVVYTFDARSLNQLDLHEPENAEEVWDTLHLVSALQGLANRESPQLYLFYCSEFGVDTDQFWFDWFRGEDGWLKEAEVKPLASLAEAIRVFRHTFKGLVVYDPRAPATSNLACTAAGCDDLLPVRFDSTTSSLFDRLVNQAHLPVTLWLVNKDGSSRFTGTGKIPDTDEVGSGGAKIDAYRWALRRYLRTGRCSPGIAAYYVDAFWLQHPLGNPTLHTLSNHDYFIARRAFFFDLSPWADESPNDDPHQALGLDTQTLLQIMRGLYDRLGEGVVKVGGFTPWPYKYTSQSATDSTVDSTTDSKAQSARKVRPAGKHDGVATEWEFGRLISQFNGYMEADAAGPGAMANASFYRHYPLAERYLQPNPKPTAANWRAKGYLKSDGKVAARLFLGHYVGDYDAPSWLYKAVPAFFADPTRGQVPLGWAFDPNLADRAPQALVYAYRHATTNDFFIAGDSGAGYLNPRALTVRPDSKLPSGLKAWTEHCRRYYDRWGMSITGFMLDGSGGASTKSEFEAYRSFSPDGAGTHFEGKAALHDGLPTCSERDLPDEVEKAAAVVAEAARKTKGGPGFFWARSILKSPKWYADLSRCLGEKYPEAQVSVVDPYTFFGLIRMHLSPQG